MVEIVTADTPQAVNAAVEIQLAVFTKEQGIPQADCMEGNERASHVIAIDGEDPVATARLLMGEDGVAEIARVAVLAPYRKAGIGRKLVCALEKIALQQGVGELELHPHLHLESFYDSLGYARAGDGVEIVGRHELITMRKVIVPETGTTLRPEQP